MSRPLVFLILLAFVAASGCTTGPPQSEPAASSTVTVSMKDVKFAPATITVAPGTKVVWVNDEAMGHTVTPLSSSAWGTKGSGDDPADWMDQGDTWSHTFSGEGRFEYYCKPHASVRDGEAAGMTGVVIVKAGAAAASMAAAPVAAPAALVPQVAEIGRLASDVPPATNRVEPAHVTFNITANEVVAAMADGATYTYWTFDATVPGPMLRARIGDTITVNFHNDASSTMGHNIDFHAVTGPGGGAGALAAEPGETKTLTFQAMHAGLFVYHCAFQNPPLHIAQGMYGLILIEPAAGLAPVDKEFYVVQGDMYSAFPASMGGHHDFSMDAAMAENPSFVVFNGRMTSLKDAPRQLQATVGDTVRLYVGNGGPNLVSSFHVIGEIFDRVYSDGSLVSAPLESVQTTLVPAGGAAMVEFRLEVPGDYYLVDHSIFRVLKGAFGVLHVEGGGEAGVFEPGS